MAHSNGVGSVYMCNAKVLAFGGSDTVLDGVSQNHLAGYSNSRVESLWIEKQPISSLPKGIAQFFPDLKVLTVKNTPLNTISRSDLSPFPNLMHIDSSHNLLEALEGDLFAENPNIVWISFWNNKIRNVGTGLLDNMRNLATVYFNINTCIDRGGQIASLKQDLAQKCPPTLEMNMRDLMKNENFKGIIQQLIFKETTQLHKTVKDLQVKVHDINNNVNYLGHLHGL